MSQKEAVRLCVPWYNKEEFEKVYTYAYDSDLTKKRWAVDQMSIWNTYCRAGLPRHISSTYFLVRAVIQDILLTHNATLCQSPDVQMMYIAAIVRFVNVTCDLARRRQMWMHEVAAEAKIPVWLIGLRNDATHQKSPSLTMLRNGAQEALLWLKNHYWENELNDFLDCVIVPDNPEAEITVLLTEYQDNRYQMLHPSENEKMSITGQLENAMCSALSKLKKVALKHRRKFFEIIFKPGLVIPTPSALKLLLKKDELPFMENDDLELPESIVSFWAPFIKAIHRINGINDFVVGLLQSQKQHSGFSEKLVVAWALKLLKSAVFHGVLDLEERLFSSHRIQFYWLQLLKASLTYPGKYTPCLIPLISAHLNVGDDFVMRLMPLIAIRIGALQPKNRKWKDPSQIKKKLLTVSKLKKARLCDSAFMKGKRSVESEKWSKIDEETIDFSKIPIGVVFGEKSEKEKAEDKRVEELEDVMEFEEDKKFIINKEEDNIELNGCTNATQSTLMLTEPINFIFC